MGTIKAWLAKEPKDWMAMLGVLLGLCLIAASFWIFWNIYSDKNEQIEQARAVRNAESVRANTAEARQRRSEARADLAEERLDNTLETARAEREFYRQLECQDIANINSFIDVIATLILANNDVLTPEQRAQLTEIGRPAEIPDLCDT